MWHLAKFKESPIGEKPIWRICLIRTEAGELILWNIFISSVWIKMFTCASHWGKEFTKRENNNGLKRLSNTQVVTSE